MCLSLAMEGRRNTPYEVVYLEGRQNHSITHDVVLEKDITGAFQ